MSSPKMQLVEREEGMEKVMRGSSLFKSSTMGCLDYTLVLHENKFLRRYELAAAIFKQEQTQLEQRKKEGVAIRVVSIMHPRELTSHSRCLVFTDHIVRTLTDTPTLTLAEAVYTLRQLLILFKSLLYTYGTVSVSESCCGFSAQGYLIGWLSPQFWSTTPAIPSTKSESAIVKKIMQIVYAKCCDRQHRFFHDILETQSEFEEILSFLNAAHSYFAIPCLHRIDLNPLAHSNSFKPIQSDVSWLPRSVKNSFVSVEGLQQMYTALSCGEIKPKVNICYSSKRETPKWEVIHFRSNEKPLVENSANVKEFDFGHEEEARNAKQERRIQKASKCEINSKEFDYVYSPEERNKRNINKTSIKVERRSEIYNQGKESQKRGCHSANKRSKLTTAQTNSEIHSMKASVTNPHESKIEKEAFDPRITFGMVEENLSEESPSNSRLLARQAISRFEQIKKEENISNLSLQNLSLQHTSLENMSPQNISLLGLKPGWRNFIGEFLDCNDDNLKQSYHVGPEIRAEPLKLELLRQYGREIKESCIQVEDH